MSNISFILKKTIPLPNYYYIGDNIISTTNWPNSGSNGSAYDLTLYDAGTRSLVNVGGHQAMRFSGTNIGSIYCNLTAMTNEMTIIGVMQSSSASLTFTGSYWSVGPENYAYTIKYPLRLWCDLGSGQASVIIGASTSLTPPFNVYNFPSNQLLVITLRYNNALWYNGTYSCNVRVNGTSVVNGTGIAASLVGCWSPVIRLGTMGIGPNAYGNRDISEFLYYTSILNDADIIPIENSLKNKYGIS